MTEKLKKNKYVLAVCVLSIIYLVITSVQNARFVYPSGCDDEYISYMAMYLLDIQWLGPFKCITLVKGIGAPLFIALANFIGIPFIKAQFLFYLSACIFFCFVIKKIINNNEVRILLFTILLFNPVMYSTEILRVYRDGIYSTYILYLVSFTFAIFLNYKEPIKKLIPYMVGLGIFSTLMELCREENIWIAPFTITMSAITILLIIRDKKCVTKLKKICLYAIPIGILLINLFNVRLLNYIFYGEFIRNEFSSSAWKDFEKAASSVDVENHYLTVAVSKEAREKLYQVSPSFAELQKYYDGVYGDKWTKLGYVQGEVENGWFNWETLYALEDAGYAQNSKTLNNQLRKITKEINQAYEDGRLKKEDNPESIFQKDNLKLLINNIFESTKYQTTLDEVDLIEEIPRNRFESLSMMNELTNSIPTNLYTYNYSLDRLKIYLLIAIAFMYETINPTLFVLALCIYIFEIFRFFFGKQKHKNLKEVVILSSLLLVHFTRIFVIAYTHTKLFPAIATMYLSSIYSIQFIFNLLAMVFFIRDIKKIDAKKCEQKMVRPEGFEPPSSSS